MKKFVAIMLAGILLSSCGSVNREYSKLTGSATQTCVDGVLYLQFTTGSTVKYDAKTDKPAKC